MWRQILSIIQPFNRPRPEPIHPLSVSPVWQAAYEARQAQARRHGRTAKHTETLRACVHNALRGQG